MQTAPTFLGFSSFESCNACCRSQENKMKSSNKKGSSFTDPGAGRGGQEKKRKKISADIPHGRDTLTIKKPPGVQARFFGWLGTPLGFCRSSSTTFVDPRRAAKRASPGGPIIVSEHAVVVAQIFYGVTIPLVVLATVTLGYRLSRIKSNMNNIWSDGCITVGYVGRKSLSSHSPHAIPYHPLTTSPPKKKNRSSPSQHAASTSPKPSSTPVPKTPPPGGVSPTRNPQSVTPRRHQDRLRHGCCCQRRHRRAACPCPDLLPLEPQASPARVHRPGVSYGHGFAGGNLLHH